MVESMRDASEADQAMALLDLAQEIAERQELMKALAQIHGRRGDLHFPRGQVEACLATADGCCPAGCNGNNDGDCVAVCDNGTLEPGEHCDPLGSCPTACPQQACNLYTLFDPGQR